MSNTDLLRILVVDDDPQSLALIKRHLTNSGFQVISATNGKEAMRIMLDEAPSIIVTDWMMPEMDGLELCRAIRSHEAIPFAYIIIVTAHQTLEDDIVEAFVAGADDYLTKPINNKELLARLRAAERIIELQEEVTLRTRDLHKYNAQMAVTNVKLAESNEKLNQVATTDALTGMLNRRAVLEHLTQFWHLSKRHDHSLSCIMLDLDRFKACNDTYGHDVGDLVLKETGKILSDTVRSGEIVARLGGEEFLIICPQATEKDAAVCAQRIRQAIESMVVQSDYHKLQITASLGVAQTTPEMNSQDDLLKAADSALYAAKDAGRNTVCYASDKTSNHVDDAIDLLDNIPGSEQLLSQTHLSHHAIVLVIENDDEIHDLCSKQLHSDGCEIMNAVDCDDAKLKITKYSPDVILMGTNIENMDALACTRDIKNNPESKHIPIILISTQSENADILAGLEAGADEYLTKPINPKEFVLRVRSMIRLKSELMESNEVRGEQSRALAILSDFAKNISTSDSLDEVYNKTIDAAAELTCSKKVCVLLPNQDQQYLSWVDGIGSEFQDTTQIRLPIAEGVSGKAFQSQAPVACDGKTCELYHNQVTPETVCSTCPGISSPLSVPERNIGVLCISDRQDGKAYTLLEQEYVHLICNIAASAIHERLTRRARDDARHTIVVALAQLAEHRDSDTGKHLDRVSKFCVLLARKLSLIDKYREIITENFLEELERAVPLHDIGKVAIPDRILLKSSALTDEEFDKMKTHTSIGAKTIRSVIERVPDVGFLKMAEEIAYSHHEWYNGQGYPQGLEGESIPLSARIATVADTYDAITSKRTYKDALPHADALAIIQNASGQHYDPDVVEAFLTCEQEFKQLAIELADKIAHDPSTQPSLSTSLDVAGIHVH